ncbi:MAG: ribosomal protein S18-alanine N-acetyltransferase [Actinomycetota bacterium]
MTDGEGLDVEIVPLRRRHLPGVLRIERQVYPTPWSMSLFLQELGLDHRVYRAARRPGHGEVLGYAGVIVVGDEGHVATVAVHPGWQRHAIGSRLLLDVTRGAIVEGATAMTLEVRSSNRAAQAMYARFGYAPAGIRKGYYPSGVRSGRPEDAVIMWTEDITTDEYAARLQLIEAGLPGTTVWSAA